MEGVSGPRQERRDVPEDPQLSDIVTQRSGRHMPQYIREAVFFPVNRICMIDCSLDK